MREAKKSSRLWRSTEAELTGSGVAPVQLDLFRFHIGDEILARLPLTVRNEWMISFWKTGCLRLVPIPLWGEYVQNLAANLQKRSGGLALHELIASTATRRQLRSGNRLHIPEILAELAAIGERAGCLMLPNQAWLELWLRSARMEQIAATFRLSPLQSADLRNSPE